MKIHSSIEKQLERQLQELKELRYRNIFGIEKFTAYDCQGEIGCRRPPNGPERRMRLGDRWKGMDKYLWLCFEVKFPDSFINRDVVGIFDFGITGMGTAEGFESLLYVDDVPYQGVDSNHKEVFFNVTEGKKHFNLAFRLWTGLSGGGRQREVEHQICRADFAILDRACDQFYFLAKNILETVEQLSDERPEKNVLRFDVVKAFGLLDFSEPGSNDFYASAEKANTFLWKKMEGENKLPVGISLIGHTHIDVAWMWRLRHTREKCARSFSTVNRLMERYPEYKFLQTQAQLYDYIKEDYPDIYDLIKNRVEQKKWEPAGSMWVECDCNIPSGESIVRQILYGKQFFDREFGYTNDYLWLPDVFGYSWALPQILDKSGIKTFITTKISWNDTNRLPNDTFLWRGIDGSEVVAHFITAPEHSDNRYYTYNGAADPYTVKGVWDSYQNKDLNTELLVAYGYGDGGGGANRDMLENISCMKQIPGLPQIQTVFVRDYLEKLHENLNQKKQDGLMPVWDGELYLEFHRGTYTSQAYNKKTNRRLEFMIRDAEMLSVAAMLKSGMEYPLNSLYESWKIIMRNQFHDIIPGSCIHEVYEDCHAEYKIAEQLLSQVLESCKEKLMEEGAGYTVFNSLHFTRTTLITLPDGKETLVKNIPAVSMQAIDVLPDFHRELSNKGRANSRFYYVVWDESGHLMSIYDKIAKREVLAGAANVMRAYEDKPHDYDAWELESTYQNKCETIDRLKETKVWETANYVCISFVWEYRNSFIRQKMYLYNHTKRIDFRTEVDWQEREKLLKVDFQVDIRATEACYDIQFGSMKRPITRNTSWESAKYEVSAHKWADLSEGGYGVSLMNDCKYGYSIQDNIISLTLLKSSNFPDYDADKGKHEFIYALYPHQGEWYEAGVVEEACDLNVRPVLWSGTSDFKSLFVLDNMNVTIDAVKMAEKKDGIIIRLHEHCGSRGKVSINTHFDYRGFYECDLMEKEIKKISYQKIEFLIKPYEIKTMKLML